MQLGTSRRGPRAAASLALLLAACGTQGTGGGSPAPQAKPDLVARLDNLPQGVVRVQVQAGTRRLLAHLDLSGLVPSTAHAVQLHRGTCLQRGGPLVAAFTDASSDAAGGMSADATGPAVPLVGGEYVELHLVGAARLAADAVPIACADISATAPSSPARMTAPPGYKPFGTVSISYTASSRAARLGITLQGLAGASVHAVEILTGTCSALGALLHRAGDATADRSGTVRTTLDIANLGAPPPPSGWIAVVRSGASSALGSPGHPAPPDQPLLCGPFARPAA